MPAFAFLRSTLFNPRSPGCCWKHPLQASRIVFGAAENVGLALAEKCGHRGQHTCPVCGWNGSHFRNFLSADEVIPHCICPVCGSFDRHRQLVLGVRQELKSKPGWTPEVMVGFSLSSAMRFLLEHEGLSRCFRTDYDLDDRRFLPDFLGDLRNVPLADNSVEWVFCSHVLEHVPELEICVDEILRVLKPGGLAWIQVPFEPGLAHSHSIRIDPYRAHAHAWQFAPDFGNLLLRDQWDVAEVIASEKFPPEQLKKHAIHPLERYWICRKQV